MSDYFLSLDMILSTEVQDVRIRSVRYWLAIEENL